MSATLSKKRPELFATVLRWAPDKLTPLNVLITVPHSKSGLVPRSSLLGAGHLGFRKMGEGGTMGEGWGK
jgi:hypothetical protein